jgi:hypothetical protein
MCHSAKNYIYIKYQYVNCSISVAVENTFVFFK